jgi:hypothetical protein
LSAIERGRGDWEGGGWYREPKAMWTWDSDFDGTGLFFASEVPSASIASTIIDNEWKGEGVGELGKNLWALQVEERRKDSNYAISSPCWWPESHFSLPEQ